MSQLHDRIAQFRKMTTDDPENELGHYRLALLYVEAGDHAEAVKSFTRALELSPQFSKVYQLLGESLIKLGDTTKAIETLTKGYTIADERGDKMPRDAMAKLLTQLGAPVPVRETPTTTEADGPETGFRCQRPACPTGKRAKPLEKAPLSGEMGERIRSAICSDCWAAWYKDYSIKVINELRLDLSTEFGQREYDKYMREFLGFESDEHQPVAG